MDKEYMKILQDENSIITEVLEKQLEFKEAVNQKSWTSLLEVISQINLLMDSFNVLDEHREEVSSKKKYDTDEERSLLAEIRGKLLKCRTENKVLSEYVNITRSFVQGIIDEALPQSRNKTYTRNGYKNVLQPEGIVFSRHS